MVDQNQSLLDNGNRLPGSSKKNAPYANGRNLANQITFSPAPGAADVCNVTINLLDGMEDAAAITEGMLCNVWLSDSADGIGLTATTASGTVTPSTGTLFDTMVAKKALTIQPSALGVIVLEITDSATTGFYVVAQNPSNGQVWVSDQLVAADYGS